MRRQSTCALMVCMLFCVDAGVWAEEPDGRLMICVSRRDAMQDAIADWLISAGEVIGPVGGDSLAVLVPEHLLDALAANGCRPEILLTADQVAGSRVDAQYLDPDEVTTALQGYAAQYPDIVELQELGLTHENRSIWGVRISDNPDVLEDEPSFLFVGTVCGRDVMSTEVAMDIIDYLLTNYMADPVVRTWVMNNQICVVPMLNPDGSAYCWASDPWWVKNRRDNGDGSRGVNLDRNFPFLWGACFGSSASTNSSAYRGPGAASEPETQALIAYAHQHSFIAAIVYQAFGEMLLTPYGCQAMTPPDHAPLNDIAAATAAVVVGDDGSSAYGTDPWWVVMLPGDGRTSDWLYGVGGALSYDILLNASTYQPSYASLRNLTVQRQRPGWQELLDLPVETRLLHGHFIDACTQQPIPGAHYSLEERPLENGEPMRVANATFGSYFLHMQTNTYHVLAQQNGYGAMRHEIYMRNGPVAMDLPLVPSNQRGLGFLTLSVDDVSGDHDYIWDPGEEVALMVNLHAPGLAVTGISGTLATNDSYVTISDGQAEFDDAPAGGTSWSTAPHFIAFSDPSTPENHRVEFILDLSADQSLCLSESMFQVRVKSTMELCPYVEFNLNANPNWTIVNSDNNGWEYGAPVSGPSSAHTGLNVYGTNLDGFYSNNCDYKLTTTPIDCSTLADTTLRFWRFLNCEEDYDDAYVSISTNGTTWTDVFHGETQDNNWVERSYDIAAYADGEPAVYVRFQLTSNASLVMTGFYVDDVVICGTYLGPPPATYVPTPTPFSTFTPTPSPTPTSTAVVTGTPGSSPTPTAVFTTPPGTITPAATATPVPGEFTLNLSINDIVFEAGDVFLLQCEMRNEGPTIMVDLLVVLDYFGSYWFYPDWTTDADWVTHQMGQGTHYTEEVLNFVWPGDVGEEYGVLFWAGCVASGTTDVVGDIRYVSFGWR